MTKRDFGKFKRRRQDAYDTPPDAVLPLLAHVIPGASFWEPCAGAGKLADALRDAGLVCLGVSDIEPRATGISKKDALTLHDPLKTRPHPNYIITNPPWTRKILHPMIDHFSAMRPTWLLFDADWMHTKQATPYLSRCSKIVSVGRVSWMQNGTSGLDNCAWYLFDEKHIGATRFFGRQALAAREGV